MDSVGDMFMDSPRSEEALFQKYLPYNNPHDDGDDVDPYSADLFVCMSLRFANALVAGATIGLTACSPTQGRKLVGGTQEGTITPALFVLSFAAVGAQEETTVSLHMVCLSVGFTQLAIAPRLVKMERTAKGRFVSSHTAKQLRILPSQVNNYPVSGGNHRTTAAMNITDKTRSISDVDSQLSQADSFHSPLPSPFHLDSKAIVVDKYYTPLPSPPLSPPEN